MRAIAFLFALWAFSAQSAVVDYTYSPANLVDVTAPTPTGAPSCAGASGVNPNAADEYIIRDDDAGLAQFNNATYQYYFVCAGVDATDVTRPTITRSGTAGTPLWVVYYNPTDPGTHPASWAWNSADRVYLPGFILDGADYWRFHRIQIGKFNPAYTAGMAIPLSGATGSDIVTQCLRFLNGADNNIINEIVCEGSHFHAIQISSGDDNLFQSSSIRYMEITSDLDVVGLTIIAGTGNKVVSNVIADFTDMLHIETGGGNETVFEDNDLMLTARMWTDCASSTTAPVQDNNGECACWENHIDVKDVGVGPDLGDSETHIVGNRMRGGRYDHEDGTAACGASGGANGGLTGKSSTGEAAYKILWARNMFWDTDYPAGVSNNEAEHYRDNGSVSSNHTFTRNLVECQEAISCHSLPSLQDNEWYLNTYKGSEFALRFVDIGRADNGSVDAMCNTFINVTTPFAGTGELAAGALVGYNAYIASGADFEQNFTGSNYEQATLANMNFDDLRITYRDPDWSTGTYTFTDVVPTATTPAAYLDLCPGTGDADTMGQRTGVGINNDQADWN